MSTRLAHHDRAATISAIEADLNDLRSSGTPLEVESSAASTATRNDAKWDDLVGDVASKSLSPQSLFEIVSRLVGEEVEGSAKEILAEIESEKELS